MCENTCWKILCTAASIITWHKGDVNIYIATEDVSLNEPGTWNLEPVHLRFEPAGFQSL